MNKLKKQRAIVKARITKAKAYFNNLIEIDIIDIRNRRALADSLYEEFNNIQSEIEVLDQIDDEERETVDNNYFAIINQAERLTINSTPTASAQGNSGTSNQQTSNAVRLPVIDLPKFAGAYEDWAPFHDTFRSLIHENETITDIQKFHYLKSALQGSAVAVIDSLGISSSNYNIAWDMLNVRYDNKRIIIQSHIQNLFDLPSMNKENLTGLRQVLDGALKNIRALKSLDRPTEHWDDLLVYIIASKLDAATIKDWESDIPTNSIPSFQNIIDFLTKKCQTLEAVSRKMQHSTGQAASHNKAYKAMTHTTTNRVSCQWCNGSHLIYQCNSFLKMPVDQRIQEVKAKNWCYNCLRSNHVSSECKSRTCKDCNRKHNTLLHRQRTYNPPATASSSTACQDPTMTNHSAKYHDKSHVILSTALIHVIDRKGKAQPCRALLDSGSQSSFMTKSMADRLGIPQERLHVPVVSINQATTTITRAVNPKIKSRLNQYENTLQCLVINKITENLPLLSIQRSNFKIPSNIKLADPDFNVSSPIDMLIGAEVFWNLLCIGQIKQSADQPCWQKTHFGWIVSGPIKTNGCLGTRNICNFSTTKTLDHQLHQFWELEECSRHSRLTAEEQACEDIFLNSFTRDDNGRFVVRLPLKADPTQLGESRTTALRRFFALEKRLERQPEAKRLYTEFINEYLELNHMKLIHDDHEAISKQPPSYYLPHHAVMKENSSTTKLRVVFDGSAKSSSGVSLNDQLMTGPTIQQDLFAIMTRFRTHQFVLTADIAKMYRQVLVAESDRRLQRILWRPNPREDVKTYELATVTYGTSSASFLAIRALNQLAIEERQACPVGSEIVLRDFYVDDLISGSKTMQVAETIKSEVTALLRKGGFELRKWRSNCPSLLSISDPFEEEALNIEKENVTKTLGLQWNATEDVFQYDIPKQPAPLRVTKRTILSAIARIFDPLGLVGPIIVRGKVMMQQLWQLRLNWDESVPSDIHSKWLQYEYELQALNSLKLPRKVVTCAYPSHLEIHGFCDASEAAYGACIYIRTTDHQGTTSSNLICAKSKVAPLKPTSLPRLELCGALLLAQLMDRLLETINLTPNSIYYWTDSTIVLAWVKSTGKRWKTFVNNRVGEIHELTKPCQWNHVVSENNPADIISRGVTSRILITSELWWKGPTWILSNFSERLVRSPPRLSNIPEENHTIATTITTMDKFGIVETYSSFAKLLRVTAYCIRFKNNAIARLRNLPNKTRTGPLVTTELAYARVCLAKLVQGEVFSEDIQHLRRDDTVSKGSKLLCLSPFLDDSGLIRVGGRLRNADIPYEHKHPVVLPANHPFTKLIIDYEHRKQLHSGAQLTLAAVRSQYWPLAGRSAVKRVLRQCTTCFKARPTAARHIMGDLPTKRITPSRPFANTGVDYCGPFHISEGKRRNSRSAKIYCAIFVCLATKAVHIELVSDLSADTFINALKRFISRRGKVANLYSDNGTNFVGANRELAELRDLFMSERTKGKIIQTLAEDNIQWHFIPPRAPHFGGLWEAAVKSTKYHLKRIAGNARLNFERLYTLCVQIEACLNSRPLIPMSNDPNDMSYLTPSHFLIGDSLTALAEPNLLHVNEHRLSHWQHIEQLKQHFWKRWSKEYLSTLQERTKWASKETSLELGQLVIIKEDNVPPLRWTSGRIEAIHPGPDGVVRVASVRTSKDVLKRPTSKLCALPRE